MLVIRRKAGESVRIGDDIKVTVVEWQRGFARIGIDAPQGTRILREELVGDSEWQDWHDNGRSEAR